MTTAQHQQAVQAALKSVDALGALFARLGTADHPRGRVLSAYRQARRALAGDLNRPGVVADVLGMLRWQIEIALREIANEAVNAGQAQAERNLQAYGLPAASGIVSSAEAITATLATFDAQAAAVRAAAGGLRLDEAVVLGDGQRVGLLTPGPVVREGSRWATTLLVGACGLAIDGSLRQAGASEFRHQAVATIDQKTTDCCLQVHGQVVRFDELYHLTGTPRYADYQVGPAFHWYCRTSEATVHVQDANDELTGQMRHAARAERNARIVTGRRETIWPSHARSGRS